MLNVRANDEHPATSFDPETGRSAGMVVLLGSDHSFNIVNPTEVLAGLSDLQKFKISSHPIQLHRKIFRLHLDLKDLSQMANGLIPAKGKEGDFLIGIISRGEEWKALNMVPMKVRERDHDLFLLVPDGEEVASQISQPRTGINNGDAVGIGERDLQAGGVTAEFLETRITDRDGSAGAIKLELHRVVGSRVGKGNWLELEDPMSPRCPARGTATSALIRLPGHTRNV